MLTNCFKRNPLWGEACPETVGLNTERIVMGKSSLMGQQYLFEGKTIVWFSCGAASAVAAKKTVESNPDAVVAYCDTLKYEHPDNQRFLSDVEKWIGKNISILSSKKYNDIFDVFDKTGWLIGPSGARCTMELKKRVRQENSNLEDTHVFGFTSDEVDRINRFEVNNPELFLEWILLDLGITKNDCYRIVKDAGIELPEMYKKGYKNNNCIGCVKGQMGYWNKIRRDFPESFRRMAEQERKMDVAICKKYVKGERIRVFLDELDPDAGRYEEEPDIECGPQCSGLS